MTRKAQLTILAVLIAFAPLVVPVVSHAQNDDQPRRIPISKKSQPAVPDSLAKDTAKVTAPETDSVGATPAATPETTPPEENRIWYDKYTEAFDVARRDKRQLLIIYETEWCKWCKAMNESTWTDDGLLSMAKSLIFTRIDADLDTAMVDKYHVNRIPTAVLASDQGVEIDRFVGYFGPRDMREALTRALEGTGTMWELDRKLTESRNDPKVMLQIVHEFIERNEPDRAKEYLERVRLSDENGDLGAADDALYVGAMLERNDRNWYKALENLKQLVKKYPESEWREDAELYIPWLLAQAGDDKEAVKKYNEFLDKYGSSSETQWVKRQIAKIETDTIPAATSTPTEGQ